MINNYKGCVFKIEILYLWIEMCKIKIIQVKRK